MGRSRVDTSRKRAAVRGRARTGWGSRLLGIAGLACAVAAVAPAVAPAAGEPCSNAEVRAQQRVSHIEGCRAYEKVSPADKGGANVGGFTYDAKSRASADGQSLVFTSTAAFGDSLGSPFPAYYTARRGSAGWSVRSATPPSQSTLVYEHGAALGRTASVLYVDPTLETRIVETAAPIAPGSVSGVPSQYSWNGNGYDLLNPGGPGLVPALGFAAPSFQAVMISGCGTFEARW